MFYVSRKVGRKYGVIDTSDGVEEFYSMKDLEGFVSHGVSIRGVDYIRSKLVITPVKYVEDKVSASKNKLMCGTATGYVGFDLKFEGDKVIALPLTDKFFDYAKENAKNGGFVLNIPDMVTHLDDNFFKVPQGYYGMSFFIILPKSLVQIGSSALSSYTISNIEFNSSIERICRSTYTGGSSLGLQKKYLNDGVFHVKCIEKDSLFLNGSVDCLRLPDIEWIDEHAIEFNNYSANLVLYLGNNLKKLYNIVRPFHYSFTSLKKSIPKTLMSRATIIYLDDNTRLEDINMAVDDSFYCFYNNDSRFLSPYIFVLSSNLYKRLGKLFYAHDLHSDLGIAIGIITYEDEEGLSWLKQNLSYACQHHRSYFKTFLDACDIGGVRRLELK